MEEDCILSEKVWPLVYALYSISPFRRLLFYAGAA